ncbi:ATP/GTP-binding protein [Saccharopolyspora sp. NPDC049426]|uniref:GTP-binding protein n=1 Tax=Saccharopolyspora sp. NPDC049426 TaxID=3155652 RepID=UPI003439726B
MSGTCDPTTTSAKIVIAGAFGVGKTTMITKLTDREPLRTEEILTEAGVGIDDLAGVQDKKTTTVALDFGRLDLPSGPKLYLFGTPGQDRFWPMWDSIALGALGAIVIVDPQRLGQCFAILDFFEDRGIPFVVAVNEFDGAPHHEPDQIAGALDLDPDVPVLHFDARSKPATKDVLVAVLDRAIEHRTGRPDAARATSP